MWARGVTDVVGAAVDLRGRPGPRRAPPPASASSSSREAPRMAWTTEEAKESARSRRVLRSVCMIDDQSVASGERSSSWGDVRSEQHPPARGEAGRAQRPECDGPSAMGRSFWATGASNHHDPVKGRWGCYPPWRGRYGLKGERGLGVTRTVQPFRSDTVQVVLPAVLRGVRTRGVPPRGPCGATLSAKWPTIAKLGGPVRAATVAFSRYAT